MTERELLFGDVPPSVMAEVRLRITRTLVGSIDGIHLDRFHRGHVYEVGSLLASYLLAEGAAEPVSDDIAPEHLSPEQQLFAPIEHVRFRVAVLPGRTPDPKEPFPLAEAAERATARRRRTRKRR